MAKRKTPIYLDSILPRIRQNVEHWQNVLDDITEEQKALDKKRETVQKLIDTLVALGKTATPVRGKPNGDRKRGVRIKLEEVVNYLKSRPKSSASASDIHRHLTKAGYMVQLKSVQTYLLRQSAKGTSIKSLQDGDWKYVASTPKS